VRFENGVVQNSKVTKDGSAHVVEPHRNSPGKATRKGGAVVIVSDDDRTERWTRVEGRMIVEHWCPSAAYPDGTPVRGVAERER
jgi:hypothetical protein